MTSEDSENYDTESNGGKSKTDNQAVATASQNRKDLIGDIHGPQVEITAIVPNEIVSSEKVNNDDNKDVFDDDDGEERMDIKDDADDEYDDDSLDRVSISDSDELSELETVKLSRIESALASMALNGELIQTLTIFAAGDSFRQPFVNFEDMSVRYQRPIKSPAFDPDTGDSINSAIDSRAQNKYYKDLSLLLKLLMVGKEEISRRQTFGLMAAITLGLVTRKRREKQLERSYQLRCSRLQAAKHLLQQTKVYRKQLAKENLLQTRKLRDQLQEVSLKSGVEFQYAKRYESVRAEQNRMLCKKQEIKLKEDLQSAAQRIDDERRISDAILSYLEYSIKKLEDKTEYWSEKYNKDIEAKDIEITAMKQKRGENAEHLQELMDMFKEREVEISAFLEVLAEKERAEEEKRMYARMATVIQSWWRGTMVRAQLGPFAKLAARNRAMLANRKAAAAAVAKGSGTK